MAPEGGRDDGEANQNTVFIDTSLDTHLATIVSDSDIISDLKNKIMLEHCQCFPEIGEIKIHCLKVKRRGIFYHLSDSLLVKSAFRASKRNWFLSADVSCLEQYGGSQHLDKHTAGDQLTLPWVTDSRSIDRHDSHEDRPLKFSLVHGSPSMHPQVVPFANQKVSSVDQFASGGSCKDVSKNMEEDRSSNDYHWKNLEPDSEKQLDSNVEEKMRTLNKEIKSKKIVRLVHEGSLEEALGSGPSMKKKRKTQRVEGNVKALEGERVLTYENSFEHKFQSENAISDGVAIEALSGEHTRTMSVARKKTNRMNNSKDNSAHDQLATVVSSSVENVGRETCPLKNTEASEFMPDGAMVMEKNIHQEKPFGMSQKENCNELVQKAVLGNELPSSLIRTSDCECDAPEVTAVGHLKGAKFSAKHKAAEKEVSSTPFIKKLHNINKDAIDSSQQVLGSTGQEFGSDRIDQRKEDGEFSLNQGSEMKLSKRSKETMGYENTGDSKRRKPKKSAAKNKDESLVKHADNLAGDVLSTVSIPVSDEKVTDERKIDKVSLPSAERNEVSEKTLIEDSLVYASKKGDDVTEKEVEISKPTESHRSEVQSEDVEDESRKEFKDTVGSKRKKKNARKSASRNDHESVMNHANDAATGTNEENLLPRSERKESLAITSTDALHVDCGRNDGNLKDNDVKISRTEENRSQAHAEGINENSKKVNRTTDGTKKMKKRTKKSAARNEDELIMKHANGDVCGMSTTVSDLALDGHLHENVKEDKSSLLHVERKDVAKEKLADVSQVDVGMDGDIVKGKNAEFSSVNEASRNEDRVDAKLRNKRNSTSPSLSFVPIEEQLNKLDKTQDAPSFDEGPVRKAKRNHKSSVRGHSDRPSKHQSTDLELEPERSKGIEHHPLPEETSEKVVVSEVSKVRMGGRVKVDDEVDIPKDISHGIDFMHYFVPDQQLNEIASTDDVKEVTRSGREKKPKKKRKELLPRVETSSDLGKSVVSGDNKRNREQDPSRNGSASQSQKSLTENENNQVLFSFKRTSEVSTDGVKDPDISNIDQIKTPKKARKIVATRTSKSSQANKGNNAGASAESSSSSETSSRSFHNHVSNKRQSIGGQTHVKTLKKTAPVVNSSQHVKSVLNTPGAIFEDVSDKSSADDNATVSSDASTRTPSVKSSSSGESDSGIDSRKNGSYATKRKEGGGKNSINSQSRLKNVSMTSILRSSSRFKKAKLSASQLEDTESQPVDFVPESQPLAKR